MSVKAVKLAPDGEPAVDQGQYEGWWISFNPDTQRFHVSRTRDSSETRATFREIRNARAFAKRHAIEETRDES